MQKGILGVADVDKGRIEPGNYFPHFSDVDIPDREIVLRGLGLILHQPSVFQDSDVYFRRLRIDYKFSAHNNNKIAWVYTWECEIPVRKDCEKAFVSVAGTGPVKRAKAPLTCKDAVTDIRSNRKTRLPATLFLLVAVKSSAFFTLVRSHFMSFTFLSARHSSNEIKGLIKICSEPPEEGIPVLFCFYGFLHPFHKYFGGFESGNIVCRDLDGRVLGDITSGLLGTTLDDETSETAEINVLSALERFFYFFHESLDHSLSFGFFHSFCLGDARYDICFCHFWFIL